MCPPKEQVSRISNGRSYGIKAWINVFVTFPICLFVFHEFVLRN